MRVFRAVTLFSVVLVNASHETFLKAHGMSPPCVNPNANYKLWAAGFADGSRCTPYCQVLITW